jgi:hypothetical protein
MSAPGSVFLISVLYQPTQAEQIEGKKKTIIVPPQFVLADDIQAAINKAVLLAPRDLETDRFEVLATNPF